MKRILMIGDVHGCLDEAKELIDKLSITRDDYVLFLGDLLDKGPYPIETVKWVKESGFHSLLGNHEAKYLKAHKHYLRQQEDPSYKSPMQMSEGKTWTLNKLIENDLMQWLTDLPLYYYREELDVVGVHGGLVSGKTLLAQSDREMLYRRYVDKDDKFLSLDQALKQRVLYHWADTYTGPYKHVFYGHSVLDMTAPYIKEPKEGIFTYGLDTGCVHGGLLTAAVITSTSISFCSVKAHKIYNGVDRPNTPEEQLEKMKEE